MTTFDEREKGYEAKLAHDEELKFKATVRRDKWLGLWAAAKLGKTGKAADDYAAELIAVELEKDGHEAILKRIRADFDAAKVEITDAQIHREMDELFAKAMEEVMAGAQGSGQGKTR